MEMDASSGMVEVQRLQTINLFALSPTMITIIFFLFLGQKRECVREESNYGYGAMLGIQWHYTSKPPRTPLS